MKMWTYIPFLILMAVTYTHLADNIAAEKKFAKSFRAPASIKIHSKKDCKKLSSQINPQIKPKNCL